MLRDHGRLTAADLIRAGLRHARVRSMAGLLVALLAAGALFGAMAMLTGMSRNLAANLNSLGADIVLVPRGQAEAIRPLLNGQAALPVAASLEMAAARQQIKQARIVGITKLEGLSLEAGGSGEPAGEKASAILVHLESWASPLLAASDLATAVPGADVVTAEQATREVARSLQPMVRLLTVAAGIALLGAVLMTGLLTSIRVAERQRELGMLRAMGATRGFLVRLTLGEAGVPALTGATAGVVGAGVAMLLAGYARGTLGDLNTVEVLLMAAGAVAVTLAVALLAALGPALRAAAMDPLDAVRRGR